MGVRRIPCYFEHLGFDAVVYGMKGVHVPEHEPPATKRRCSLLIASDQHRYGGILVQIERRYMLTRASDGIIDAIVSRLPGFPHMPLVKL